MKIKRGSTSVRRLIFIADTSQTNGAGLANLVFNSSGLVAYYIAGDLNNEVQITLVSATLGTFTSGGFVAVDNTNMPGWYEIGIPDAALDGGNEVAIQLRGAANMAPVNIYIELDAVDYQNATSFGLSKFGDIETDTQDIQNRLPSGLVDGRMAAIAQVVGDKLGYKIASDGLSLVTQWAVAITGNITGNVTGSVGSISGVTFPANFGLLGIDGSGAIGEVVLVYELDGGALTANNAGDPIAGIVWNALTTTIYTDQSFGDRILISNNNIREISVTGSGHIASVLHDAEPNSIPEDAFVTGALSARVLASDAVTEVVNGVWNEPTSSHTTAGTTGKALIDSGAAGNPWSTDLATGYSGTQAGNILNEVKVKTDTITTPTINVYPVSASTPERVQGTTLTFYRNESRSVSVVTDFTLTSLTLQFTVEDADGVDVYTLANGSISRSGQTFTIAVTTAVTGNLGQYRWSMRDISGGGSSVIAMGVLTVQEAASNV